MNIRLSFSTAALFPRESISALRLIQEAGFAYAELMPQCYEETKPSFAKKVVNELKIKIGSIHFPLVLFSTFYNPYPGMVKEAKALIDNLTESAGIFKAEVIVIHPPYFADETIRRIFHDTIINNLQYLCEASKKFGVKVALENSPKGGKTLEELLQVIKEVNHENIFPMLDTTEAVESEQNPLEMVRKMEVIHLHISDHDGDMKHILPGEGKINWKKFFEILREKQFTGLVTVEPSYRHLLENPVERMKKTKEFLEKL